MNTQIHIREARSSEAVGQIGKAIWHCNQALFLDPKCVDALLILGSISARQGRTAEAEAFLRRAAETDPNCYDAVRWLCTLLIGKNGGLDAVEFGRRAIDLRPNEAEAHVILGLAFLGTGESALAISSLETATRINPQMGGAFHNLGVAYQRDESYEEAIIAFHRATELSPGLVDSYLHLGRCYLAKDMGDEAIECAQKAMSLSPNSASVQRLFSDARFAAVHGPTGLQHIAAAIDKDPRGGFPHALMGSRLQELGDFDAAEASIQRSIELQPVQGFAYYLLAHNRKIREDDRPQIAAIEAISQKSNLILEESQYIHFALGKAYDDLGDYEKAIRHFDLAHEQDERAEAANIKPAPDRHSNRVHRFTQLFTKEVIEQFAQLGLESEEPIFIFGMPRSGTTLLEQILSRHSTVGAAGELFFWRDRSRRIVNFSEAAINTSELTKAGHKYLDLIRELAPGKAHVTDKFPSNYAYLGLLHLIYPKAKFIHARRNPLDTSLSIYMRPFSTNQGLGRTRRQIVETYQLYREAIQHWRETLGPDRFLDVDYEWLVQNPEENIREIIEYCGLEWEDACLRPEEGDRRVITFSKWQVRQPVYTTSVERWRRYEPWLGVFSELIEKG